MKILILSSLAAFFLGACASTSGAKPYPLKYCVVSDNELGSMGDPVTRVYDGQEITFCCKPCIAKFEKNPKKYLDKLQQSSQGGR